jgi:large conductance mechanosensitive channel
MKKLFQEFGKFIAKGNVVDLAVAIMLGTSFQRIVSSLVNHILMPLISWLVRTDLGEWFITLQAGVPNLESESGLINPPGGWLTTPIRLNLGLFTQSVIDFLMIALLLFFVVKLVAWSQRVRVKLVDQVSTMKQSTKRAK